MAAERCGPTASTVLEEQLHALVVSTVHSRMARSKDCSVALSSVYCDQWLMVHPSRRQDLIGMKGTAFREAAGIIVRSPTFGFNISYQIR